jgi:hypothetical protein
MVRKLPGWGALFAQVEAEPEGGEHLAAVIRYLLWIGDEAVHHALGRVLHSVLDLVGPRASLTLRETGQQQLAALEVELLNRLLGLPGAPPGDSAPPLFQSV